MTNLRAVYYRDRNGHEPVRYVIDALEAEAQAVLLNQIDRLNLLSDDLPHLPFPHSSQVDGELRELRCHYGRAHYRVLYRRSARLLTSLFSCNAGCGGAKAAEVRAGSVVWSSGGGGWWWDVCRQGCVVGWLLGGGDTLGASAPVGRFRRTRPAAG